jgi:hypothetical protein
MQGKGFSMLVQKSRLGTPRLPLLALLITVVWTISSYSFCQTDLSVFKFQLGKPLNIPECSLVKEFRDSYRYRGADPDVCFERMSSSISPSVASLTDGGVEIRFPAGGVPDIIANNPIVGIVIQGNLEGVGFTTAGVQDGERVLKILKDKYGEPTDIKIGSAGNLMGATFPTITAGWVLPGLTVRFKSVANNFDTGTVTVDTPKASAFKEALIRKLPSGPTLEAMPRRPK